mmetsp:Transcript_23355/g.65596  ORF Transcript_23355/g.65596 Transcript_23355/m.65596 type:complete len:83 (+) Transcript_23355:1082-1330(+)
MASARPISELDSEARFLMDTCDTPRVSWIQLTFLVLVYFLMEQVILVIGHLATSLKYQNVSNGVLQMVEELFLVAGNVSKEF